MTQYYNQPFASGKGLQDGSTLDTALAQPVNSLDNAVSGAGTTLAGATQLNLAINIVTTAAASSGVKLPLSSKSPVGTTILVFNDGASPLTVYSADSTIDGTAGATGVALANAKRCAYLRTSPTAWESYQLGAVSA